MKNDNRNIEAIYPLSPLQRGMLFHSQVDATSVAYAEQLVWDIQGDLDPKALKKAWQVIVSRHAVLRTQFVGLDTDKPLQVVRKDVSFPWRDEDLRDLSHDDHNRVMESILENHRKGVTDLSSEVLVRFTLAVVSEQCYKFVFSYHHALMDGWSLANVRKELLCLYEQACAGRELSFQNSRPYIDYIRWLNKSNKSDAGKYWRNYLAGFDTPILLESIPNESNTKRQCDAAEVVSITLSEEATEKLKKLIRKNEVTLNTLSQAIWGWLLMSYSGEDDVVFGTVVSGRPAAELDDVESMVGSFINTVPLRLQLDHEDRIWPKLKDIHFHTQFERSAYEHTPLFDIQKWSNVSGGQSLFQTLFVFENYPLDEKVENARSGILENPVYINKPTSYPLTVLVSCVDTLRVIFCFDPRQFNHQYIQRLATHFRNLMESVSGQTKQKFKDLDILTEEERKSIVFKWNDTDKNYNALTNVSQFFTAQTARTPDTVAAIHDGRQLTYAELNELSDRLANYLLDQGIEPDARVGLCVERSLNLIVGVLGILKAGAAYVPLDISYPQKRLAYMTANADVSFLVTQKSLKAFLPDNLGCVELDNDCWLSASAEQRIGLDTPGYPEHLAYVIYTSGSTGKPKAVAMPHASLVNLIHWQLENSCCNVGSRTLQFSPISFDVSFQEIFSTLASGGTLVLVSDDLRRDPFLLWRFIKQEQISRLFMPFIALQQLAEVDQAENEPIPTGLQEIITAGEQLQISPAIRNLFGSLPACKLFNHYGPSESHVVTSFRLEGPTTSWEALPPIGKPIANNRIYILDRSLKPVPVGVYGEIYIGGVALARGYLGDTELTRSRFVDSPFVTGEKLYKTGDVARYRQDGNIEYKGRTDNQIKIRGFRVELGEVERKIAELPGIREAVVSVFHQDKSSNMKYLAAFVVTEPEIKIDSKNLTEALVSVLPEYMIPSVFTQLDVLPLTPSGKIDRKSLPKPILDVLSKEEFIPPITEMQKSLVSIWSEVLEVPAHRIGINDDFFSLGGHSLLATRVVSHIRKIFNLEIQIKDLFIKKTVKSIASFLEMSLLAQPQKEGQVVSIKRADHDGRCPLSFAQQRLWFLNKFENGKSTLYNIPVAYRLTGELDVNALRQAFSMLIERHQILRTSFHDDDGQGCQVINEKVSFDIPVIDADEDKLPTLIAQHAGHVFDLTQSPLLKVTLLRLKEDYVLLINIHHLVADGWSMGIINQEIASLYKIFRFNGQGPLSLLPIQYADFSVWQRRWLRDEVMSKQLAYWERQLEAAPETLNLPTDYSRPAQISYNGSYCNFNIPETVVRKVKSIGLAENATTFMTMFAAFNILLARVSGEKDICIGIPIANRQYQELEAIIGLFVNTLVLRTKIDDDISFKHLLGQVKENTLSAYAHQDVPFEHLVERLDPERSLSHSPLFQVSFILQNTSGLKLCLPDLDIAFIESGITTSKFDLTMILSEGASGIDGVIEYSTDLFKRDTIEELARRYLILLESIAAYPNLPISKLPLLEDRERKNILLDWNDTTENFDQTKLVHQLIEEQAVRLPQSIAVICEDKEITYENLNFRSNQIAHHLIDLGVTPETKVGLYLDRSIEMIVAILAVLKAGGCYVPLDPKFPVQRTAYMLMDADIRVVLTKKDLKEKIEEDIEQRIKEASKDTHLNMDLVFLDEDSICLEGHGSINPNVTVLPSNLVYIIYTSGSTGLPKGAMLTQGSLLNFLKWVQTRFQIDADDVLLHRSPFIFDASVWEWALPLMTGGKLVLAGEEGHKDLDHLVELIDSFGVTVLQLVPSILGLLLENKKFPRLRSLKHILVGGEALTTDMLSKFLRLDIPGSLCNEYGPSETTIACTSTVLDRNAGNSRVVPIGRPISNVTNYILDDSLNPVPVGIKGKLYIGGECVGRGYLNKPDITAENFIPDPFSGLSGARLYSSHDLARYLPDGQIEFLGRSDHQVKIRGFRIEIEEIEQALRNVPGISKAIVTVQNNDDSQRRYLSAYLVLDNDSRLDSGAVDQSLMKILPEYMIPSVYVQLDKFPMTPSGKIDRKALPDIEAEDFQTEDYVAASSELEECLAEIWSEVLGIEKNKVGVLYDFFALGGNSISLMRVIALCKKRDIDVSVKDMFRCRNINSLASFLTEGNTKKSFEFNLAQESELGLDISVEGIRVNRTLNSDSILLTGGTGFIGAFLLKELLNEFDNSTLYCLVRADSDETAKRKVAASLKGTGLFKDSELKRIVPIRGDLAKPGLGMNVDEYEQLADTLDFIVHNGAWVNHVYPYNILKAANVNGTHEILKLATRIKLKAVHYVSVVGNSIWDEETLTRLAVDGKYGYSLSKYIAENLVQEAYRRGVPVSIQRLGMIAGDSVSGTCNIQDRICLLVKGCIELKCIPDEVGLTQIFPSRLTPVDYVAKYIARCCYDPQSFGKIHNIDSAHRICWQDLILALDDLGYELEVVPLEAWKKRLLNSSGGVLSTSSVDTLLGLYRIGEKDDDIYFSSMIPVRKDKGFIIQSCSDSDITCPEIDRGTLINYLSYMIAKGFIESPHEEAIAKA